MGVEEIMRQLLASGAFMVIVTVAGSALAADLLLRAGAPVYAARLSADRQTEPVTRIRPLTERLAVVATTAANARDSHVLEFLRWKEQQHVGMHRTESSR
jgi:hypothetical protein